MDDGNSFCRRVLSIGGNSLIANFPMNYFSDPAADYTFALRLMMGAALTGIALLVNTAMLLNALASRVPDHPKATQDRLHRQGVERRRRVRAERQRRLTRSESPAAERQVPRLDLIEASV